MGVTVLDTTVLIDVLRGRSVQHRLHRMREQADVAATSAINVEEVVRGLRPAEHFAAARLLDGLLVIPVDASPHRERAPGVVTSRIGARPCRKQTA